MHKSDYDNVLEGNRHHNADPEIGDRRDESWSIGQCCTNSAFSQKETEHEFEHC